MCAIDLYLKHARSKLNVSIMSAYTQTVRKSFFLRVDIAKTFVTVKAWSSNMACSKYAVHRDRVL
jgi:hypothetical protein